jgi:hypothetical protein
MPNHCLNVLNVEGPEQEIQKFKSKAKGKGRWDDVEYDLTFDNFVPTPKSLLKEKALANGAKIPVDDSWYTWSIVNWGTKWDAYSISVVEKPNSLIYYFDTAWSPPVPLVSTMISQFPELRFHLYYEEPGCDFEGDLEGEDGEILFNETRDWHPTCQVCEEKFPKEKMTFDEDSYDYVCNECFKEISYKEWDHAENKT